jgi:hypothetical protein
MLLFWPERESAQLPALLAEGAAAEANYLRAALRFWSAALPRIDAERSILVPARRLCGLAANAAEETLDRTLLEHDLPLNPQRERTGQLNRSALTFTTYLRRLTQTITTLAAIGSATQASNQVITQLADRLEIISAALHQQHDFVPTPESASEAATCDGLAPEHFARLLRQVSVLERTAAELTALTQA